MDLRTRITRRRRTDRQPELVLDYDAISPVAHLDEPTGRGPLLERLLDHLDPVFDGRLPPNAYVHGPAGAGKSAVVTALFDHLGRLSTETRSVIHTSTRDGSPGSPGFVYVDTRAASSEFAFYRTALDALVDEAVPEHGISTAAVRTRLHDRLGRSRTGVVVAVDHAGDGVGGDELVDLFAGLPSNVSWLAVGRSDPDRTPLTEYTASTIGVGRYERRPLVDIVTARASNGLAKGALSHELAREIADGADGNAHDALAALLVAAVTADRRDDTRLTADDVDAAFAELPERSTSLARVMVLSENRLSVLRSLVDLDAGRRGSVTAAAEAVAADQAVDLSSGTVTRLLYELAEADVLGLVRVDDGETGRPASRVELRFPPTGFRRLYDLRE